MAEHLNTPGNRAVVVSELVEQLLPTPEIHCSNPVISKNYAYDYIFDGDNSFTTNILDIIKK